MNFDAWAPAWPASHSIVITAVNFLRPNDREEVFMPIGKSKPSQSSKLDKNKKPSKSSGEIRDDDLRSVSGGLANTGGVRISDDDGCITKIG